MISLKGRYSGIHINAAICLARRNLIKRDLAVSLHVTFKHVYRKTNTCLTGIIPAVVELNKPFRFLCESG